MMLFTPFRLIAVAALAASFSNSAAFAAKPADTDAAVIVIFQKDTPFNQFEADAHDDERSRAAPQAWGYLNRGVLGAVQRLEGRHGFKATHVYSRATNGFSGRLSADQIAALRSEPTVAYVEQDQVMKADAQVIPWGIERTQATRSSTLAGNGSGTVSGVTAYIIDTGISGHADLNALGNVNFAGGQVSDCNGHGTHVAGTIGAIDNGGDVVGMAPGLPIVGVKVLDCTGSGMTSNVIKGVDWVTAYASKPAVANMSLGGTASQALDDAVVRSVASGVFYAVAAGNSGLDACTSSPARAGYVASGAANGIVTTAATDNNNAEASFSNYGQCVDVWAPGVSIQSTYLGGGTAYMSGTSMATPHVAGAGALYLSRNPAATPAQVETAIRSNALYTGTGSKDGRQIQLLQVNRF